jgi:hypothetical protein
MKNNSIDTLPQLYRFCGEGAGVPGLPHVLSREQAEAAGVSQLLDAAIDNGNYAAVSSPPVSEADIPPFSGENKGKVSNKQTNKEV